MEFRSTTNRNYAQIVKQSDGTFCVFIGYDNGTNNAYGNETIYDRKIYKSEKMAIKKAEKHIA